MDIRLAKICSMGLKESHLMQNLGELQPLFEKLKSQFNFNVCGEGGEYESAVLGRYILISFYKLNIL